MLDIFTRKTPDQTIPKCKSNKNLNKYFFENNLFLVPFKLIRCARGGGVSEDIENVSLDILAQKRLEEGLILFFKELKKSILI